ncbi:MAG TPA: hypothetical protein V6C65_40040 [Allocoleopsis sp.]
MTASQIACSSVPDRPTGNNAAPGWPYKSLSQIFIGGEPIALVKQNCQR